jgi:hypothetical protein
VLAQWTPLWGLYLDGGANQATSNSEKGHRSISGPAILDQLYYLDDLALSIYKGQFAAQLTSGNIPAPCAADMKALGITATQWAGALTSATLMNGIGSTVALSSILPVNSAYWQTAVSRNLTVGGDFLPGSGTWAVASVNGPQSLD